MCDREVMDCNKYHIGKDKGEGAIMVLEVCLAEYLTGAGVVPENKSGIATCGNTPGGSKASLNEDMMVGRPLPRCGPRLRILGTSSLSRQESNTVFS